MGLLDPTRIKCKYTFVKLLIAKQIFSILQIEYLKPSTRTYALLSIPYGIIRDSFALKLYPQATRTRTLPVAQLLDLEVTPNLVHTTVR